MVGFIAANLLGLLRQVIINRTFGTGAELDAYYVAFGVPDLLFSILAGGALGSAFIPMFAGLLTEDTDKAWRLASAILNILFVTLVVVAAVAALLAPWLVQTILAPHFPPEEQALAAGLMRVMLVSTVIFGLSGLLMGIHNAQQHFIAPAIAPVVYNLGIILGALLATIVWQGQNQIYAVAWGVVLGATLHMAIQLPVLFAHKPRYFPVFDLGDPAIRQVGLLMLPRMFGLAVWQINFLINKNIGSGLPEGSITSLAVGFQIFTFPQAAIAQAIAIAVFPTLAAQAARGEKDALRHTLSQAVTLTLFLALPATLGLILLGRPIIALLFEGGEFTAQSTTMAAWALTWYASGLAFHSVVEVITRAFYALKDTRTPVWVGVIAMIVNVILSFTLVQVFMAWGWMPHGGLALANTLATGLEMLGLAFVLRGRLNGLALREMVGSVGRSAIATGGMVLAVLVWAWAVPTPNWLFGLGGALVGAAVYFGLALLLKSPELSILKSLRRRPAP